MAINWDEIREKARARGKANEQYIQSIQRAAAPSSPKVTSSLPEAPLFSPSVRRIGQPIAQVQREKIAAKTYEDFNDTPTKATAGFIENFLPVNTKQNYHPAIQQNIEDFTESTPYRAGQVAGTMAQFSLPYAGASKGIGAAVTKIPQVGRLGRFGQGVARSVATDIAVGLPLNVNYALNKEGLQGAEAAKSIGVNTAIDLITGGILEAVPLILKSGKKVASKADFDALPVPEKQEVVLRLTGPTEPQKLLSEGINWREPIRPDFYVNRGGAASPNVADVNVAGLLPAPARTLNPMRRGLAQPQPLPIADFYVNPGGTVAEDLGRAYSPLLPAPAQQANRFVRNTDAPEMSFVDFVKSKGIDTNQLASDVDYAEYIGGSFTETTKAGKGKLKKHKEKIDLTNRLQSEYRQAIKSGEIKTAPKPSELSWNSEADRAYVRMAVKRAERSGDAETARAWQRFYDNEFKAQPETASSSVMRGERTVPTTLTPDEISESFTGRINMLPRAGEAVQTAQQGTGFRGTPKRLQPRQLPRANRETPFTVTRGEMSSTMEAPRKYPASTTEVKPGIPAQAPTAPAQPVLPKKGTEISKEQPFAQSGLKSVGADTFKGEKTVEQLVNEYGALPKGEQPRAREVDIPKKTDYGEVQQYARTLQESAIVDDTLFKDINEAITQGSFTKPTKSNKTAVENANFTLEQAGLDGAMNKFRSVLAADKTPTSEDIALGNRVLQELQKEGRYGDALDVAIDLSQMLSETGRTLQAARIAKRLSPEGRLMHATRIADKITKKTGKKITLSDETIEQISKAKTEDEIVKANQKAAVEMWNQIPANWIDKVNSWRYMAMLTNPKTHIRNIVGNALFVPAREFKNLIGAGLERALIKDGVRTKAVLTPKDKALLDFASKDFQNVKALLKNEGKLDDNVRSLDAKVFDTKVLEGIRKLNLKALDAEDTWFMKFAYDSSLAQYMKANKITPDKMVGETLENARKYAMNEALKATYRDFNALSNLISRGKAAAASGKYGPLGRAGGIALEGAIPFSKTPLNIIKRGVAYSPANIVRGVVNLGRVKSGKVTATEAIDQLASGLSGTALMGLGVFLGYNNIVKGKGGEYKDKLYNYNQMLGSQNYSLNIGGNSYTIDWAAPLSMPFFVGVELAKAIKDNNADLAAVLDAMTQISDPMVNLSMLKGINDIMTNNFEGFGQTAFDIGTGYAGQFNPTLFGQIARTMDDTRRSTISTAETGTMRGIEKFGRKQLAKLPGASQKLEPYVDLWGREQKNASAAENFLSPGYFKSENITPVDRELQSLMKGMDEETIKKILPTSTAYQYTIQSAGLPYRMTEKESTAYQKTRGQESYKGLEKLFKSAEYREMTQEEKVDAIQDIYSDAHQKAKYQYFDSKGLPVTLALDKDYQEKFRGLKGQMTDKRFYAAVTDMKGKSRDIEKVFAAEQRGKVSDKFFEAFKISEESVEKARALKSAGLTADQYTKAMDGVKDMESDKLPNGKAIDNSLSKKKKAYIDSAFPNVSDEQLKLLYELAGVSKTVGHYRPRFE
jgi:hypothetical protein